MNYLQKLAAVLAVSLFALVPVSSYAATTATDVSGLQAEIASLLKVVASLEAQIAALHFGAASAVTVTAPNGGETIAYNSGKDVDFRITWTATNLSNTATAWVSVIFEGGLNPGHTCLLGSAPASTGSFALKLPANASCMNGTDHITPGQYEAFVNVSASANVVGATDTSNAPFTLVNGGATNQAVPVISGVDGKGGFGSGDSNTVYGKNFSGTTKAYIIANTTGRQTSLSYTVVSDSQLTLSIPQVAGDTYTLYVTNKAGTSVGSAVGWIGPMPLPIISSVSGKGGFGTGDSNSIFGEHFTNAYSVYLENNVTGRKTVLPFSVSSDTRIDVTVPQIPSGTYILYVYTNLGSGSYAVDL